MAKLVKKRTQKSGLPPGTLIHIGEKRTEKVKIRIMDYSDMGLKEMEADTIETCFPFKDKPTNTWINIEGIHDVRVLERLGECYGFHSLILEDILNTDQRPKMEDHGEYIYVVLKMLNSDKNNSVVIEQISLLLGKNFVISLQEGLEGDVFNPVRERIRSGKGRIRKMGSDYLAYALLDSIVDNYFIVLEKLGEKIEVLEEELITNPKRETLHAIHNLKREMIFLRKSVWPLREVISGLERGESSLISKSTQIFLRDLYDHTIQVIDTVEAFRDMLSGMLDIYLSSVSNKMNEVMKVLTIIATIFIPLTFIAGVYGMNFRNMPEIEWQWGYPLSLLIMGGVAVIMLVFFRKKRWI
ncbi:MAG: magnesium and cobalt transport protein CorA [Nitrospirae bacterium RIFCSPLOWO2_02_42_7]|nr:MAG: magnesium and cobalt transport protein CorA [Nitrospirae bacterium RIFCSPLOWO2_02_42_7]